jgi:rubrerythrin
MQQIKRPQSTVYMCTYCGTTALRSEFQGRPAPGYCPRRGNMKDGKPYPHRWVISRKI